MQFIAGVVFGVVLASVGVSGIANIADRGIYNAKTAVQEQAAKAPTHEEIVAQLRADLDRELAKR